jgi:hypothetical protein
LPFGVWLVSQGRLCSWECLFDWGQDMLDLVLSAQGLDSDG